MNGSVTAPNCEVQMIQYNPFFLSKLSIQTKTMSCRSFWIVVGAAAVNLLDPHGHIRTGDAVTWIQD